MSELDEKTRKLGKALARLRDGLQGLQPAIEAIDNYLNYLGSEANTAPALASTTAPSNIFPKDLADMLSFEEQPGAIIIRPRHFLGSENFAKIAATIKEKGGYYVSAGKESHFRIPRKK